MSSDQRFRDRPLVIVTRPGRAMAYDPRLSPLYPQRFAEIMAVKRPLSPTEARMPDSLQDERVGPATAREIGWIRR
jgi:hypothetical protein